MVTSLLLGLGMGLAAGVSPGPLLFLTIAATLRDGRRAGVLVALAPLLSDLIVVTAVVVVLGSIPAAALGVLGVVGGVVVMWLGVQSWREARLATLRVEDAGSGGAGRALWRGFVVNLLSPHPWVFWATALGPLTVTTWRDEPRAAVALVLGFYVCLVGAKVVVALALAPARGHMTDRTYRRVMLAASAVLVLVGLVMAVELGLGLVA